MELVGRTYIGISHDNSIDLIRHHWAMLPILWVHILVEIINHSWRGMAR